MRPLLLMKEPVPPRPLAPTDTSAFERADASASGPVPSMAAAGSLRPSAASSPCRAAVSPMGHVRKRLPMALAILLAAMLSLWIFFASAATRFNDE